MHSTSLERPSQNLFSIMAAARDVRAFLAGIKPASHATPKYAHIAKDLCARRNAH